MGNEHEETLYLVDYIGQEKDFDKLNNYHPYYSAFGIGKPCKDTKGKCVIRRFISDSQKVGPAGLYNQPVTKEVLIGMWENGVRQMP